MTWNYRIVKYRNGSGYGLHEVFYDDRDRPITMTDDPIGFAAEPEEGPEGVVESLRMALRAVENVRSIPPLDEPEEWPGEILGEDELPEVGHEEPE